MPVNENEFRRKMTNASGRRETTATTRGTVFRTRRWRITRYAETIASHTAQHPSITPLHRNTTRPRKYTSYKVGYKTQHCVPPIVLRQDKTLTSSRAQRLTLISPRIF